MIKKLFNLAVIIGEEAHNNRSIYLFVEGISMLASIIRDSTFNSTSDPGFSSSSKRGFITET